MWQRLPAPRRLTASERDLLLALLRPTGNGQLRAQVKAASVVGTCACGCSSLQLATTAEPLHALEVASISTSGRYDYVGVGADGTNAAGQAVQVAVHVLEGVLIELEVYAGEGVAAPPPPAKALKKISVI